MAKVWTPERVDELIKKVMASASASGDLDTIHRILDTKDRTRKLIIASAWFFARGRTAEANYAEAYYSDSEKRLFNRVLKLFPYPIQDAKTRAFIVLGESPKELSGNRLTNAEAHEWLSERDVGSGPYITSAQSWFIEKHTGHVGIHRIPGYYGMEVWTWVRRMLQSPQQRAALLHDPGDQRAVQYRMQGGRRVPVQFIGGAFIRRLDELISDDLTDGVRSTFERARLRHELENADVNPDEILAKKPRWWVDDPRVKLLLTARELATEGCDMRHCVGDYALAVKEGQSLIFTINFPGCRSTVQVDYSGAVLQHRAAMNSEPNRTCVDFLTELVQRWVMKNEIINSGQTPIEGLRGSRGRKQLQMVEMKVIQWQK